MMKGWAPSAFTCSTVARTIASMLTTPRLPTVRATDWPGFTGSARRPSAARTATGTSSTVGPWNACFTRIIRGKLEARGIPVSFIGA